MRLTEILNRGFVSYIGDEMDVALVAFKDKKVADRYFKRLEKEYQGTDSGTLRAETMNGYHIVGEMDWKQMDLFEGATFVAFAPTEQSCKKLSDRILEERDIEGMAVQLGFNIDEAYLQ